MVVIAQAKILNKLYVYTNNNNKINTKNQLGMFLNILKW
jgi:hypothetical protein